MAVGFQKFYFSFDAKALQESFIKEVGSTQPNLDSIHVLVPNHYVAAHLKHLLAQKRSLLNIRFFTISDLAKYSLRTDESFLSKIQMTPEMELFRIGDIAKKVLRGSEQEIVSNKRGFHQNLKNLFHHLIGQGANKIPAINPKTKSFNRIFQAYLELKKDFYNDPWLIEASSQIEHSNISKLSIIGITKFSPLEMRWLNQIAKNAAINFWMERGFFEDLQEEIFTWAGETFAEAIDIGNEKKGSTEIIVQPAANIQDEAIWIAQTIFGDMNRKLEASEDASKALRVPGQNGLHRTGIFLNDFRTQKTHIEQALKQFNIPYVVYGGAPLTSTRLGQAIEQLTELVFQNWKRDAWIRFLQTFPFNPSILEKNGTQDQWNQWTIEANITDKNTLFIPRLEHLTKNVPDPKLRAFIEWQKDFVSALDKIERSFSKNPIEFFESLFELIQTHADIAEIPNEFAPFFDDLIYFSKGWDVEFEWNEIKPVILEKLKQHAIQTKVFESDGVFLAPVAIMPGLSFDTIFMPHMNEGCFPKPSSQSFDITSKEMFKISQSSKVSFPSAENDFNIQKFLFDSTPSRTQNFLISYASVGLPNQEELRPSIFIHEFSKEKLFVPNVKFSTSFPVQTTLIGHVEKYAKVSQAKSWSEYNALISNPQKKKSYSSRDIQLYLSCPRQYYLSQVLRLSLEDYPEDQFQVNPLDKGNLVHEILFKVFSKLKSEQLFPLEPKNEDKIISVATSIASECFDRFVLAHAYGSEELWNIDREELLVDVTQYIKHEIKEGKYWVPYALEYRFGMPSRGDDEDARSTETPVELPVLGKSLAFRGKVDRIDLSPDKKQMRIIDYKTGAFKHVNWNYEKGTNLQIPLYMLLSRNFFPEVMPDHVEGTLVHVKSFSKFDKRTLSHESLASAEEKILELLDLADTGINQGKFYPNPGYGKSNCRLCDFQTFCGDNIDRDIESIPVDDFMNQYKERKESIK